MPNPKADLGSQEGPCERLFAPTISCAQGMLAGLPTPLRARLGNFQGQKAGWSRKEMGRDGAGFLLRRPRVHSTLTVDAFRKHAISSSSSEYDERYRGSFHPNQPASHPAAGLAKAET